MTQARDSQISLSDTPYYHCMARCVRRAYLCGEDGVTGRDFSHRRGWIVAKLKELSTVFSIDICAYAVMSNHYHVVLRVDSDEAEGLSDKAVMSRWMSLFKGSVLTQRYLKDEKMSPGELIKIKEIAALWRTRLMDISWFMRCLNESIARMANEEDNCKGRFWEGRFKSQALLDDVAVLTCMAYVDLNPVRAQMVDDLIDSDFTSVQERLFQLGKRRRKGKMQTTKNNASNKQHKKDTAKSTKPLLGFAIVETDKPPKDKQALLPFNLQDYLDLVDRTGRCIREDKRGALEGDIPPILTTLGINPNEWLPTVTQLQERFELVIGAPEKIKLFSLKQEQAWCWGYRSSLKLYRRANVVKAA